MQPCFVISLIIISNSILLSLLLIFTYYFVLIYLYSQYTKSHQFIIEKHTNYYLICWNMLVFSAILQLLNIEVIINIKLFIINKLSTPSQDHNNGESIEKYPPIRSY